MKNNKYAIESLSMDLMRVANGYHKGSIKMAKRFSQEALLRRSEINIKEVKPYFAKILKGLPTELTQADPDQIADRALMYSIISKNYSKTFA